MNLCQHTLGLSCLNFNGRLVWFKSSSVFSFDPHINSLSFSVFYSLGERLCWACMLLQFCFVSHSLGNLLQWPLAAAGWRGRSHVVLQWLREERTELLIQLQCLIYSQRCNNKLVNVYLWTHFTHLHWQVKPSWMYFCVEQLTHTVLHRLSMLTLVATLMKHTVLCFSHRGL